LIAIIGHMGEVPPFMSPRLDRVLTATVTRLERAPSDYLRHNVYYTFSGFNWIPTFLEVLLQVGVDRMMFSTDHPHRSMTEATAFLAGLPLMPHDRERIAHDKGESRDEHHECQRMPRSTPSAPQVAPAG
jgi:predicted TIM-barrel fold metal-dependent hydrolase